MRNRIFVGAVLVAGVYHAVNAAYLQAIGLALCLLAHQFAVAYARRADSPRQAPHRRRPA